MSIASLKSISDRTVRSHEWGCRRAIALSYIFSKKGDRPLPKQKKPGFLHNFCLYTDILCKNPVSEPPGGLGGSIAMYGTSDKSIGKVLTTLTVTNRADQSAAVRGFIPTEQIRSITLDNVLVDQGATTLCLRCCCDRHSIEN
ncbi:MAG: hypothetical protein WCD53_07440 [Microcoleus sp.]